jgi:hypothetical protein
VWFALAGMVLLGGALIIERAIRPRDRAGIILFERGIALTENGTFDVWPYGELDRVHRKGAHTKHSGRWLNVFSYTMGKGERTMVLDGRFGDPETVARHGEEIQNGVTAARFEGYAMALRSGSDVRLGDVTLGSGGVTAHGRTLPWTAITGTEIMLNDVLLTTRDGGGSLKVGLSGVPFPSLLITLVEAVRSGRLRPGSA